MVRDFVRNFPKVYRDFSGLVMKNRIFVERTRDVGVLSREEAIAGGATGPVARASGVVRDLRRDEPYLAYEDFDFDEDDSQLQFDFAMDSGDDAPDPADAEMLMEEVEQFLRDQDK